jgi:hypothetical protein
VARSRWDRREVPRLGTRVGLAVGEAIAVPTLLDEAASRAWSRRLGAEIDAAERRAGELAAG